MTQPNDVSRREFTKRAMMAAGSAAVLPVGRMIAATGPVISKITILTVPGEFVRPVAQNAYDQRPVGKSGHIRLVRVFLSDGTVGLRVEGYAPIRDPGMPF